MTVNERLFSCGLLDAFDEAMRRRDRTAMIDFLINAAATREQSEETVDAMLSNPTKYVF